MYSDVLTGLWIQFSINRDPVENSHLYVCENVYFLCLYIVEFIHS